MENFTETKNKACGLLNKNLERVWNAHIPYWRTLSLSSAPWLQFLQCPAWKVANNGLSARDPARRTRNSELLGLAWPCLLLWLFRDRIRRETLCVYLSSKVKIKIEEVGSMVWQIKPLPVLSASHMSAGLSSSCSTSKPAAFLQPEKAVEDSPTP